MTMTQFKFTPLRMDTPWSNLTMAIGLIQTHILAEETSLDPQVIFGTSHWERTCLETAVALLAAITGEAEALRWHDDT